MKKPISNEIKSAKSNQIKIYLRKITFLKN